MKKSLLITGASSGMGKACALHLAEQGYLVYAGSRTPEKLAGLHEKIHPVQLDVADAVSVKEAVACIKEVDVLINNAGYGLVSSVEEFNESQMHQQFEVNVFGLLRVTKAVVPKLRQRNGGVIINISSFLGKIGLPLLTFYNASKYAVEGITDSLRYELHDFNIRVHSVMPGFFDTEFARKNLVVNERTFEENSPYYHLAKELAPQIIEQINHGNDPMWVAQTVEKIIEDPHFPARVTVGEKARKFIPMRKELSDEDFERRVREYYGI